MAGSAAPEQTGTEADIVFGIDSPSESSTPPTTKALPEVDAAKSTEESLAVGVSKVIPTEESVRSPTEPEPKPLGVTGGNGQTGKLNLKLGHHVACVFGVHMMFVKCFPVPDLWKDSF